MKFGNLKKEERDLQREWWPWEKLLGARATSKPSLEERRKSDWRPVSKSRAASCKQTDVGSAWQIQLGGTGVIHRASGMEQGCFHLGPPTQGLDAARAL